MQLLHHGMTDWDPSKWIEIGPPAIIKPIPLYTGKQLVNFILKNVIPEGMVGITMDKKSQTPSNVWNAIDSACEEGHLIVYQNYVCTGVLDRAQLADGKTYSLIHSLSAVYGAPISERFMTATARIFSAFLQEVWGFSARIEDFVVRPEIEENR
eukprot:UN32043